MNWLRWLYFTLLYIVLVFEKSRQFCANIFGNTMCRSFLKKEKLYCDFKLISPPLKKKMAMNILVKILENIFGLLNNCFLLPKKDSVTCITNIFNNEFEFFILLPKDTVIGIANNKEAKQSVRDVDVQHKVQWIFLSQQYIILYVDEST